MNDGTGNQVAAGSTCSVCRLQRKMCAENCIFARHFPLEKTVDFYNVQRLFGIRNVIKMLNCVAEDAKDETLETLIVEARIRALNPVHGAIAVESRLRAQIKEAEEQLDMVRRMLGFFKVDRGADL